MELGSKILSCEEVVFPPEEEKGEEEAKEVKEVKEEVKEELREREDNPTLIHSYLHARKGTPLRHCKYLPSLRFHDLVDI